MRKHIGKFQKGLIVLTWVLGIQFLLLPFFHFHPESVHSHTGQLAQHQHKGHFHSLELENIAHLTRAHDHDAETKSHHSHHPVGQDEDHPEIELNKETLKPQKPFTVLKVSASFSAVAFYHLPQTSFIPQRLNDFAKPAFKHQLRERSPPFLAI